MQKRQKSWYIECNNAHSYNHSGFYAAYPQPNYRVLHVQPLIKTQGFTRFALNHHHGFYMSNPKPSRVLW